MKIAILLITTSSLVLGSCFTQRGLQAERSRQNKIDFIQQPAEAEALIRSIDKNYSKFRVNTALKFEEDDHCSKLGDVNKFKSITKADIDGNGLTDMLVMGHLADRPIIIAVLDSGNNKFYINRITRRTFTECSLAAITAEGKNTFVEHNYFKPSEPFSTDTTLTIESKKLIFKFDDFVEYNKKPGRYRIEKIVFISEGCEDFCPRFTLEIKPDYTIKLAAGENNIPRGNFEGRVSKSDYSKLVNLLSYSDFPNLNNHYTTNSFHEPKGTLQITYDSGKIKTIKDYGLAGTYGLDKIYQMLVALKKNYFKNVRAIGDSGG